MSMEGMSLKAQLNEYKARLSQMEDEKLQNERVLQKCRAKNIDLQAALNDFKGRTQDLLRKNEGVTIDIHSPNILQSVNKKQKGTYIPTTE